MRNSIYIIYKLSLLTALGLILAILPCRASDSSDYEAIAKYLNHYKGSAAAAAAGVPDDSYSSGANTAGYLIHAGDKLNIKVYREDELSGIFTVDPYGKISYPLLGEVTVEHVSVEDLKNHLTAELGKAFIRNPQVQVELVESRSKSVSLLGQVVKPGNYILSPGTTLVNLISQVGGFAPDADQENIRLMRVQDGLKRFLNANMTKIIKGEEEDITLEPGDVIFIDPANRAAKAETFSNEVITILGQVARPGNYPSKMNPTLVRLIGQAGGFTALAANNRIKVVRREFGQKKVFYVNFRQITDGGANDVELGAGDIVEVPESMF